MKQHIKRLIQKFAIKQLNKFSYMIKNKLATVDNAKFH